MKLKQISLNLKSIPKKTMYMTKKLILFAIILLTLLCAQELQSQTIVTLDYMDCFQALPLKYMIFMAYI